MKSIATPWTHTAVLRDELRTTCKGRDVVVPAGTVCHKLDGGSEPWVVGDLSFIEDKNSILYHDADHYGIVVPENALKDIFPSGLSRGKIMEDIAKLSDKKTAEIQSAIERGADKVDRTAGSQIAFLRGARAEGKPDPMVLSSLAEIAFAENALRAKSREIAMNAISSSSRQGEFDRPWNVTGRTWLPTTVPGPWAVENSLNASDWKIINTVTGKDKLIGPVSSKGVNYFDRAVEEAEKRNHVEMDQSFEEAQVIAYKDVLAEPLLGSKFYRQTCHGPVLGVTDHHVVQSLGKIAIIHEKSSLDRVPEKGDVLTISYDGRGGLGKVSAKEQGKGVAR